MAICVHTAIIRADKGGYAISVAIETEVNSMNRAKFSDFANKPVHYALQLWPFIC